MRVSLNCKRILDQIHATNDIDQPSEEEGAGAEDYTKKCL